MKLEKTKAPTFFKKYQNGKMKKERILSLGNGQEKTREITLQDSFDAYQPVSLSCIKFL